MEPLFKERQYFRQAWLWLTLTGTTALVLSLPLLLDGPSVWKEPYMLPLLLIPLPLILLFALMRLDTEIRQDGIYVRLYPFHKTFRFFPWKEIAEAQVRQYAPIAEYGGWGLRGADNNKAFNVSGDQGLQLVLRNGKKLLIGTQRPADIAQAVLTAQHQS